MTVRQLHGTGSIPVLFKIFFALFASIALIACSPDEDSDSSSSLPALRFQTARAFKSKMLYDTQSADQTYKNTLLFNGNPVTSDVSYKIAKPAGYTGTISIDANSGEITFQNAPGVFSVQATHAQKTATYTFTITDHFF